MKKMLSYILIFSSFLVFPTKAFALLGFDFDINSAVSTSYDDNVTFVKDNKKSDSVTNLIIGLGAKQEGKSYKLNLEGNFIQHLYANNSSFNNNSQDIKMDFHKEFTKYDQLSITNRFVHAEAPRSFEDDFGRDSGRFDYYRNVLDTEYTREVNKHVSIVGRYGNENYTASKDSIKDSLLHRVGFDINYILSSATAYLMGYEFMTRNVDDGGNADVHTISTGVNHFLTKQLNMDIRAGVSQIEGFDGSNASEPSINVALTNDFSETDSASITYKLTSKPSTFRADIFDAWRIAVNLKRQLLERLKLTVSVFFGEGEFKASGIEDKKMGTRTLLSYDVRENAKAFIAYTFSEVDSNLDSRDYRRNLVELGMNIAF